MRKVKRVNWEDRNQTFSNCGKAPYRFIGLETQTVNNDGMVKVESKDGLEHWTTPGGTCAVCGTYISVFYNFKSKDGVTFHVGSECALQSDLPYKELTLVQRAKKHHNNQLRWAREEKKIKKLEEIVSSKDFSGYKHPNEYFAKNGKTMLDYINYVMEMSGNGGKIKLLKMLESL